MYGTRKNELSNRYQQDNNGSGIAYFIMLIIGIGLLVFGIVWIIKTFDYVNNILNNQNTIADGMWVQQDICILNHSVVEEAYNSFCLTNVTTTEFLFYVDDLEDKITNNYIISTKICIPPSNIVVYLLANNPNTSFPVANSSVHDGFVNGLPNICVPGISTGNDDSSPSFVAAVLSILNGTFFNQSVIHYNDNTIQSLIGKSFINRTKLTEIDCFIVECYCYGFKPIYAFTAPLK